MRYDSRSLRMSAWHATRFASARLHRVCWISDGAGSPRSAANPMAISRISLSLVIFRSLPRTGIHPAGSALSAMNRSCRTVRRVQAAPIPGVARPAVVRVDRELLAIADGPDKLIPTAGQLPAISRIPRRSFGVLRNAWEGHERSGIALAFRMIDLGQSRGIVPGVIPERQLGVRR